MSTAAVSTTPVATTTVPSVPSPVETFRRRNDEVRRRLTLATDVLAVAHLLIGMNLSVRSVGRSEGSS